jgi:hypothetical protein
MKNYFSSGQYVTENTGLFFVTVSQIQVTLKSERQKLKTIINSVSAIQERTEDIVHRSAQAVTQFAPSPGCIAQLTISVLPKMPTLLSTSKPSSRTPVCRLSSWKCCLAWPTASLLLRIPPLIRDRQ